MRHARVLITGSSGFIGTNLAQRLARDGWLVRAAARKPDGLERSDGVEAAMLGDLAARFDWRPLVDGVTHVVHLAGIAHASSRIPEGAYRVVNAEAVRALALAACEAGVKRVVLMSSVRAQCGVSSPSLITEASAPAPMEPYGRAKLEGERLLADTLASRSTDWCVLRPVVVYGRGVKGNMASLLRLARTSWPLPLATLPGRRSLLGLPNLEAAVMHALTSPAATRATFLVADPEPLTLPEIIAAMRGGLGRPPGLLNAPVGVLRVAARFSGQANIWERIAGDLIVSTTALEASGWQPVETARQGITRWMREAGPHTG